MPQTKLWRARYSARRLANVTTLTAIGETPNMNDKVDFKHAPFMIYPPIWSFEITSADISLPAITPFRYEEAIPFPSSQKIVKVIDADGMHEVPITEIEIPPIEIERPTIVPSPIYCVFRWIGVNPMMIAKCTDPVPAVYERVFGPATHGECENYIVTHGGITK